MGDATPAIIPEVPISRHLHNMIRGLLKNSGASCRFSAMQRVLSDINYLSSNQAALLT